VRDLKDLQHFYKNQLRQPLDELEAARKGVLTKLRLLAPVLIAVNALLIYYLPPNLKAGSAFTILGSLVLFGIAAYVFTTKWQESFKSTIIPQLLAQIDPSLRYNANGKIESQVFDASRLYDPCQMYAYDGEDLITGQLLGMPVSFCELDITTSSSKKNQSRRTIFQGMFLVAEVDSGIEDSVWLLPVGHMNAKDALSQLSPGIMRGLLKGLLDRLPDQAGEQMELEDAEFMRLYSIYAESEETALRLLTDDLRRHLIALQRGTGQEVRVSFQPGQISVALSLEGELFEPRLRKTVLSYEVVRRFIEDFSQAYGILAAVHPAIQQAD
jgi:hypothetical protein